MSALDAILLDELLYIGEPNPPSTPAEHEAFNQYLHDLYALHQRHEREVRNLRHEIQLKLHQLQDPGNPRF